MEMWQIKMEHERDYWDSRCESISEEPMKHPDGSVNLAISDKVKMVFREKEFWKLFAEKGHDIIDPKRCKCVNLKLRM